MIEHKEHFHGSDLEKIEEIYGIRREDITSFSANVNPLGISPKMRSSIVEHVDAVTSYPDREYKTLRKAIGTYASTPWENILVGNGATELISLFIQIKSPKKALILSPSYSEYEREISLAGGQTCYYFLKEENDFVLDLADFKAHLKKNIDFLVICNPNNPTSTALTQDILEEVLTECGHLGIFVMIDETYVEFAPQGKAIEAIPLTERHQNLVVLRGVSKFFASPGLRMGYAVTGNQDLLAEINTKKNPWTLNSLAVAAGELMFSDTDYIQKTKDLIASERNRIYQELSAWDSVKPYAPSANFILVKILKKGVTADDLFDHAIRRGLMIRNCCTFPGLSNRFFRFCFMSPEKNRELLGALKELL